MGFLNAIWQYVIDLFSLPTNVRKVLVLMADMSAVLNEVADGLRGPLATSITALIEENATLRESNATLAGEDVAESAAADNVKAAFDEVAAKFAPADLPDVPPLPEPAPEPTP